MLGRVAILILSIMVLPLAIGCASTAERKLSTISPRFATLPNGHDPLNPERLSPIYDLAGAGAGAGGNFARNLELLKGRSLNMLSVSGGGQNGAFGAGFLAGWSEAGHRPSFDIVAGVSTGALLATHAFLGTAADDVKLEEMYTQITHEDIYESRSLFSLAFGADSLKDTTPLKGLIARFITAETLERVVAASEENRLLFVGTTNIDYAQTWIWNMSLIAKAGELELYREVLRASASFPIVFPPVEIDGHLFVDGAARSNIVVAGTTGTSRPTPPPHGPGTYYLIDNGKLTHPPEALRRALGDVAATTIGVMMDTSMQSSVTRAYFGVRMLGYHFKMVGIPDSVNIGKDPLAFDPDQMRAAYDAGLDLGRQADPWKTTPPHSGDLPDWMTDEAQGPR
jgi:hypothetical protein